MKRFNWKLSINSESLCPNKVILQKPICFLFKIELIRIQYFIENQKTESDHQQEQSLLEQMMAIIDERNEIIENMIQDENREIEDYHRITEKVIGSASSLKNIVVCESKNIRKNPKRIPKKLKIKLPKFTTFNHRSKVKSHSQSAS